MATLILGMRGHTGKTTLAEALIGTNDAFDVPTAAITVDNQERLTKLLGDRVNLTLRLSADISAIVDNAKLALRHYNPILNYMIEGRRRRRLRCPIRSAHLRVVPRDGHRRGASGRPHLCPGGDCTDCDAQSIEGALQVLTTAKKVFAALDAEGLVSYTLVTSGHNGNFDGAEAGNADLKTLRSLPWVRIIDVPVNRSEFWIKNRGAQQDRTVGDIVASISELQSAKAECQRLGMDIADCRRERRIFMEWAQSMQGAILPLLRPSVQAMVRAEAGAARSASRLAAGRSGSGARGRHLCPWRVRRRRSVGGYIVTKRMVDEAVADHQASSRDIADGLIAMPYRERLAAWTAPVPGHACCPRTTSGW